MFRFFRLRHCLTQAWQLEDRPFLSDSVLSFVSYETGVLAMNICAVILCSAINVIMCLLWRDQRRSRHDDDITNRELLLSTNAFHSSVSSPSRGMSDVGS